MTEPLSGQDVARQIGERFPAALADFEGNIVSVNSEALLEVARYLRDELGLDYLASITAVDYPQYFELVYHLNSLAANRVLVLKTRCEKGEARVPSLVSLWQGADFQEREVYDLMGVSFDGHPDLRRIFLWEGFNGHPLQKGFELDVPGGGLK